MFCQSFNFGLQSGALLSITQLNFFLSATSQVSQIYYTTKLVVENSKLQFFQHEIRISFLSTCMLVSVTGKTSLLLIIRLALDDLHFHHWVILVITVFEKSESVVLQDRFCKIAAEEGSTSFHASCTMVESILHCLHLFEGLFCQTCEKSSSSYLTEFILSKVTFQSQQC